jgi:hypothetical protein
MLTSLGLRCVVRLYTVMLRLFPTSFQNDFGDEMVGVFTQRMASALPAGGRAVLGLLGHELLSVPYSLWLTYQQEWKMTKSFRMSLVWIRVSAIVLVLFILLPIFTNLQVYSRFPEYLTANLPALISLLIAASGPILAWRSLQVGGWVTIFGGLLLGVNAAIMTYQGNLSFIQIVLAALLWSTPSLIFGLLFLNFARHQGSPASVTLDVPQRGANV